MARLLFIDRSTSLETIHDLRTRARGGMVSSLFFVTDYLSRRGHTVDVLAGIECEGVTSAGVRWRQDCDERYDAIVFNRGCGGAAPDLAAKARILWTHDLPHAGFIPEGRTAAALADVVYMSRYARDVWRAFNPHLPRGALIPNGVDKRLFFPREDSRERLTIIYASAPNRGLKRLEFIHDAVRSRTRLPVRTAAYSNLSVLHPNERGVEVRDEEVDGYGLAYSSAAGGFQVLDPVPQSELAAVLGRAGLMLMPSDYPEICSNNVLQALASGVPVVTTGGIGSASEWVRSGRNGYLTRWQPVDYMVYQAELIRAVSQILSDESLHRRMMRAAARTRVLSWDQVGNRWHKLISRHV